MNNTCNKTSNNKYFSCPARMDDGRAFTDYRPSSDVNNLIRMSNNLQGSYQYRQFLIHNGEKIMNINNQYTQDKMGCDNCTAKPVPFQSVCEYSQSTNSCKVVNQNGVGVKNIGFFK